VAQPENFSEPVTMYGRSPVWVGEGFVSLSTVYVYTGANWTPVPYPGTKLIWEVGPTTYPAVTARVTDLRTGELAWWSGRSARPESPALTFGPAGALPAPDFQEHLSVLIFTLSGCYKLDVTWAGGGWYTIFAVGGRT
jgi:hypothetical protein